MAQIQLRSGLDESAAVTGDDVKDCPGDGQAGVN